MKTTILFLLILISNIYSQNDSVLSVDHSKVTLSTDIIPQWKLQAEVGGSCWYSEFDYYFLPGSEYESLITYYNLRMNNPSLSFRIGILKNTEFRMGFVFIQELSGTIPHRENYYEMRNGIYSGGPIEAGLKIKLLEENKILPSTAIKADVFIPAGDYYFHMDKVSPLFKLMLKKNISKNFSIGANAGYGWNVYDFRTDKYGNFSYSFNFQVSNKLGVFAEQFSLLRYKYSPDHRVGAGLTYRFAKNVMAVMQGGFGLSEGSPDIFGSGGIGFMFP